MMKRLLLLIVLVGIAGETLGESDLTSLWQELTYLDFRGVTDDFEQARESAEPGSETWAQATLGLAVCYHQRQPDTESEKLRSAELYEELIAESTNPAIRAQALLLRGRLAALRDYFGDEPDVDSALGYYNQLLEQYPDSQWADLAAMYRSQVLIYSFDPENAKTGIEMLLEWMQGRTPNEYTALHWLLIGQTYHEPLQDYVKALEAYENALLAGLPVDTRLDFFYWQVANLAELAGRNDLAIQFYTRLIVEVERSSFGYEAQLRIKDLGGTPPELVNPFTAPEDDVAESEGGAS